jgi:hypothetical protein
LYFLISIRSFYLYLQGLSQSSGLTIKTTADFFPFQPVCVYGKGFSDESRVLANEQLHDVAGTSSRCNKTLQVNAMHGGHKKRFYVDGSVSSKLMGLIWRN